LTGEGESLSDIFRRERLRLQSKTDGYWRIKTVLATTKTFIIVSRVARFFLVQNTKTGKNMPNYHELYQMSISYNTRP
jgi:hypothetical protein